MCTSCVNLFDVPMKLIDKDRCLAECIEFGVSKHLTLIYGDVNDVYKNVEAVCQKVVNIRGCCNASGYDDAARYCDTRRTMRSTWDRF